MGGLNTSTSFAGTIATGISLTKAGTGTLTLSGTNTYTGVTTVSAGTLKAGSATALGTGAATVATGAVLDLNGQNFTSQSTQATLAIDSAGAARELRCRRRLHRGAGWE